MIVQLDSIDFNQAGAAGAALSARVDRATPASMWTRGATVPSPAVFALQPTAGLPLSLLATFSFPDLYGQAGASVTVRATPVEPDNAPLGAVDPTAVAIPMASASVSVSLPLRNAQLADLGVGRYKQAWHWEYQAAPNLPWTWLGSSDHVVYVTLDQPGAPWSQGASTDEVLRWPWTRVLDWSCQWAQGVRILENDLDAAIKKAAKRIEAAIYDLGQRQDVPVRYADDGSGGVYVVEYPTEVAFLCTNFLDLLDGKNGPAIVPKLACSDCASALIAFSNILGADLTSKRLSPGTTSTFHTNQILVIGDNRYNAEDFTFHEVTGRGPTVKEYRVFDGCLQIDRDDDPTGIGDHDFGLAQGLLLFSGAADPKSLKYVHRLVVSDFWPDLQYVDVPMRCLDQCAGTPAPLNIVTRNLHDAYLKMIQNIGLSTGDSVAPLDTNPIPLPGFVAYHRELKTPALAPLEKLIAGAADFYYAAAPEERVGLSIAASETPALARNALAWVLAQSPVPLSLLKEGGKSRLGDAGFSGRREGAVYLVRGNLIARLTNNGREPVRLLDLAATVDSAFARRLSKAGPPPPAGVPRY